MDKPILDVRKGSVFWSRNSRVNNDSTTSRFTYNSQVSTSFSPIIHAFIGSTPPECLPHSDTISRLAQEQQWPDTRIETGTEGPTEEVVVEVMTATTRTEAALEEEEEEEGGGIETGLTIEEDLCTDVPNPASGNSSACSNLWTHRIGPVTDYGTSVSKWMSRRRMNWRGQTRDFLRPAPGFVIDVSCLLRLWRRRRTKEHPY